MLKAVSIPINPPRKKLLFCIFSLVSLITMITPTIATSIQIQSEKKYLCLRKNIDKKAANIGTVAIAVRTINTDASEIPTVNVIDCVQKRIATIKLLKEKKLIISFFSFTKEYQIKNKVGPIIIPLQNIKVHVSEPEILIRRVSGIKITTPKRAKIIPFLALLSMINTFKMIEIYFYNGITI